MVIVKVRYLGETSFLELTHDKIYGVLSIEKDWYRIVDDGDEGYLYPPDEFEIAEPNDGTTSVKD